MRAIVWHERIKYKSTSLNIQEGIVVCAQQSYLETLWRSPPTTSKIFQEEELVGLPNSAQRYLAHAIAPGTPLAKVVHLKMHGEIKLKGWLPFRAEQVIYPQQGMIWQATVWMNGLPIRGWDRLVGGEGEMQWKLFGLLPVMTASGADITRSAIGRMHGECIWLPAIFCDRGVTWTALDEHQVSARLTDLGEATELTLTIDAAGQLRRLCFQRWGNPEGAEYVYAAFGAQVQSERTFLGYTIPTQLQAGWYFDSDRFKDGGEFFRVTVDEATYR